MNETVIKDKIMSDQNIFLTKLQKLKGITCSLLLAPATISLLIQGNPSEVIAAFLLVGSLGFINVIKRSWTFLHGLLKPRSQ